MASGNCDRWEWGIILLVAISFVSARGCVRIDVNADGWAQKLDNKLEKSRAIMIAKDKVKSEGINPDDYKTSAERKDGVWWVMFDAVKGGGAPGRPSRSHFSVRVTPDSAAIIFNGR